jgi:hypothetical protein
MLCASFILCEVPFRGGASHKPALDRASAAQIRRDSAGPVPPPARLQSIRKSAHHKRPAVKGK